MEKNKERLFVKVFKIVFTVIAVVSIIFVFYNIGVYTDSQEIEAFTEIK